MSSSVGGNYWVSPLISDASCPHQILSSVLLSLTGFLAPLFPLPNKKLPLLLLSHILYPPSTSLPSVDSSLPLSTVISPRCTSYRITSHCHLTSTSSYCVLFVTLYKIDGYSYPARFPSMSAKLCPVLNCCSCFYFG